MDDSDAAQTIWLGRFTLLSLSKATSVVDLSTNPTSLSTIPGIFPWPNDKFGMQFTGQEPKGIVIEMKGERREARLLESLSLTGK